MFDVSGLERTWQFMPLFLDVLGAGAITTIGLTFAAFIVAVIVGLALALMRLSNRVTLRTIASIYLELFRNIPILTQLFILYFGLSYIGINLPAIGAAIIGLGLNGAAILSEVFRSSILAVDKGQAEAGYVIGLTKAKTLRFIVLPQALKISIPSISNFVIVLLKDTSLASAAAVPEMMYQAKTLVSQTYQTNTIYLLLALAYLVFSLIVSYGASMAERSLTKVKGS